MRRSWIRFVRRRGAAALALLSVFSSPATGAETVGALEDIVVSAQKVDQNLQTVPVAVTAFDSRELERARIEGIEDLVLRAPSFSFYELNKTQVTPALRGASSVIDAAGADQPVAIFLDEVYLGSTGDFEFDLFDLERIEVLRGPQGTVFGRNVTGGAINIVTAAPAGTTAGVLQGTAGRFGQRDLKGNVTGPLGESLSARLAFSARNSDGWVKNGVTGTELEQDDVLSLRGQVRYAPSDRLDVRWSADWLQDDSVGQQRDLIGDLPQFAVITSGSRSNDLDIDGGYDRRIWGQALRINYKVPLGTLTSVTGFRRNDSSMTQDGDGTPVPAIQLERSWDIRTFTQELRLASRPDARWRWLAGLYYFDQSAARVENYGIAAHPSSFIGSLAGGALNNTANDIFQTVDTRSYAAFAQADVPLAERVSLVLGGRYTWEKKSGLSGVRGDAGLFQDDQPFTVGLDDRWSAFTPKVGVNWQVTESAFAYASVSRGFKSGGFAVEGSNEDAFRTSFDPEFATSYEIGAKTRWLDDRLQLNAAVFHVEYEDLQVQTIDESTGRFFVANVGKSSSRGAELELLARPIPALDLALTYGYLDAELDEFVVQGEDLSGNTPPLAPKHSLSANVSYTASLGPAGTLTLRGDYLYKSAIFFDASNFAVPDDLTVFDGVVNASLTFRVTDERWEVALWGKNLTDERVAIQATPNGVFNLEAARFLDGEQSYGIVWNDPRTYGISVTWRFGNE